MKLGGLKMTEENSSEPPQNFLQKLDEFEKVKDLLEKEKKMLEIENSKL